MPLSVQPKPHFGNEAPTYLPPAWIARGVVQPPYRQVSVAERVYREAVQSPLNQPLSYASTEAPTLLLKVQAVPVKHYAAQALNAVTPLWAAPLRNMAQLMNAEIHTTQGKTYTGGEVLADAAVRMVKADGHEVLNLVGSAWAAPQAPSAGILTGGDLLNSMSTLPFLVGIGSMVVRPKGSQLWDSLFARADAIKSLRDVIDRIESEIASVRAKKDEADLAVSVAKSKYENSKKIVDIAASRGGKSKGRVPTAVKRTAKSLKIRATWAGQNLGQQTVRAEGLAHQLRTLEAQYAAPLAMARNELAGLIADTHMAVIQSEASETNPNKPKSKRAGSK